MSAVKFDAGLFDSPRAIDAGPIAMYLHVAATAYCARYQTDGIVSVLAVRKLIDRDAAANDIGALGEELPLAQFRAPHADFADRLVDVGLWAFDEATGTYAILDYLDRHPSRAEAEDRRAKRQDAGRKGGLARHQKDE